MKEIQFDNAKDMFNALQRSNEHWLSLSKEWIFRGQANASWPLLPSTLRAEQSALTHHPDRPKGPYPKTLDQIEQELEAVLKLYINLLILQTIMASLQANSQLKKQLLICSVLMNN